VKEWIEIDGSIVALLLGEISQYISIATRQIE
jgi:hypothetical protein